MFMRAPLLAQAKSGVAGAGRHSGIHTLVDLQPTRETPRGTAQLCGSMHRAGCLLAPCVAQANTRHKRLSQHRAGGTALNKRKLMGSGRWWGEGRMNEREGNEVKGQVKQNNLHCLNTTKQLFMWPLLISHMKT